MPWSEWITPDPTDLASRGQSRMLIKEGHFSVNEDVADNRYSIGQAVAGALQGDTPISDPEGKAAGGAPSAISVSKGNELDPKTGSDATVGQHLYTVAPVADPLTYREWFPSLLGTLTEGSDYAVIPGKDPLRDDDAYIEYEDQPNALLGWNTWTTVLRTDAGELSLGDGDQLGVGYVPRSFALRVAIGPATYDPKTEQPDLTSEWATRPYGWGSELLAIAHPEDVAGRTYVPDTVGSYDPGKWWAIESDVALPIDLPADQTSFSLVIQNSLANPMAEPPAIGEFPQVPGILSNGWGKQLTQHAGLPTFVQGDDIYTLGPEFRIQMPRWRYWIPGELPLRQRQRDDGLGMTGTPRWRGGTSRQSSNRWRGYL